MSRQEQELGLNSLAVENGQKRKPRREGRVMVKAIIRIASFPYAYVVVPGFYGRINLAHQIPRNALTSVTCREMLLIVFVGKLPARRLDMAQPQLKKGGKCDL